MYNQKRPNYAGRFRHNRNSGRVNRKPFDYNLMVRKAVPVEEKKFVPVHKFEDFAFSGRLNENIRFHGYQNLTPVQDGVIPRVMEGKDVVGIAQTGTGKTASFLLPLINSASGNPRKKVLIIAPTRELAMQIDSEFRKFATGMRLSSAICMGGQSMSGQINMLNRSPQFVIGTPGRLLDLEQQRKLDLSRFTNVVLDEVDRMMDMGFIRDIGKIMGKTSPDRQTLFFSATVPDSVRQVMNRFLKNPVTVEIEKTHPSDLVNQDIVKVNGGQKIDKLQDMLVNKEFSKVLLFARTKWGIEKLTRELDRRGFRVAAIHGNKRQSQRVRALEAFRHNKIQVLLATDVASRGIDVPDITHVINYDIPQSYEDYIHRIGRTGRADKIGSAITFVD